MNLHGQRCFSPALTSSKFQNLDDTDTNPTENHQSNGSTLLVNTHPYTLPSPPEDASVASATPPARLRIDADDAALQVRESDLPDVRFLGADYMLYGVYQDWVH